MAKQVKRGRTVPPGAADSARLRLALRAINEGVYDWDVAGGSIFYSESVYSVLRMPRSVKTPQDWRRRIHPEDLPGYDAALVSHFKRKTSRFEFDYRYRDKDRRWRWARQHGVAVRDARGRVLRLTGSTGDITALKEAERALAETQERYSLATRAATEGIYDWNVSTGTLYLSERGKAYFAIPGRLTPAAWSAQVNRADLPGYRAALRSFFKSRASQFAHEYRIRSAGGGETWILDRAVAVRGARGRVLRMVGAVSDITLRKRTEIELRRARDDATEALERQTATSEVVKVISNSPTDVQPTFKAILESTARVCESNFAALFLYDGAVLRCAAHHNATPSFARDLEQMRAAPSKETPTRLAALRRKVVHVHDYLNDRRFVPLPGQKRENTRTVLSVPLLRDGQLVGVITTWRREVRPFDPRHVELLQTFAEQAVIAVENVRLFSETREALERQTATAEILKVIAGSPSDVQPVFDTIVKSALALCKGLYANVFRYDGELLHFMATKSVVPRGLELMRAKYPMRPDASQASGRVIISKSMVRIDDVSRDPEYDPRLVRTGGPRRMLAVPMMRDGAPIGVVVVAWGEPGPILKHHEELLQTFADQAVIAIENVRLFNETREALERQTATAEILNVIASSPSDVQPVFDTIVRNFVSLCGSLFGAIFRYDGEFVHFAGSAGFTPQQRDGVRAKYPVRVDDPSVVSSRAILARTPVHIQDILTDSFYDREHAATAGWRRMLAVPMLREGEPLGAIVAAWAEAGAIPKHHEELLRTFADQAVIAIENVRLFNETREALERQTATAEILKVISRSPTDVQPALDAIAQSAARLFSCDAGIQMVEDGKIYLRAAAGPGVEQGLLEEVRKLYPIPFDPQHNFASRTIANLEMTEVLDTEAPGVPAIMTAVGRAAGFRSVTQAPLVREHVGIGTITLNAPVPGFRLNDKQRELLRTFADQAVIAIENARLFNETREALERQTATAEILKVIAGSPADVSPVFESIAESASRLCGALFCAVFTYDGRLLNFEAHHNLPPVALELMSRSFPRVADESSPTGRAILARSIQRYEDVRVEAGLGKDFAEAGGWRAFVAVPMLRDGIPVGAIGLAWVDAGPVPDSRVEILKTFADQAVIAIENVRLFKETREALERQTAISEILERISSSPTDVMPVLRAVAARSATLCEAEQATVLMIDGDLLRPEVTHSADQGPLPNPSTFIRLSRGYVTGRAVVDGEAINVEDVAALIDSEYPEARENQAKLGFRSFLAAPMMRQGKPIGVIAVWRRFVRPFSEKHVALVKTFADQAAIAIENVRLFKELQSRTEALTKSVGQLTALGEVGQAISSTLDLETVLQTIVSRAVQLSGMDAGSIYEYDEQAEVYRLKAAEKMAPELVEAVRQTPIRKGDGATGRTAVTLEPVQAADIQDASYQGSRKDNLMRTGYRAVLAVPLLREDHLLGALQVFRRTPGAFAPEVVELLKTFATQSAMAIQNARLFREIADKGRQLEEASRHKSDFLASMSHELRTPLNAILGFNEMLLGQVYGEVPADMKEPLEDIQKSGKHLLRLINNVLDLAKIEAGRMELSVQDYSVQDTVESVRATLRPLAAEKGLAFAASVPGDLPLARGDGGRIAQCLMNLAGNSLKFTKAGKVEINVTLEGDRLRFSVADTGIGIPADKIGGLFTEFKQTDASIASEYGGTGLGLSITKKFIEMHGGRIWVESEPGRGSTFRFEVPLRVSA